MEQLSKQCKKVVTFDHDGKENGWLLEINSVRDGFTKQIPGQVYLTVASPGAVKGFHLHQKKLDHFTCIKGKIKLVIFDGDKFQEFLMGEGNFITVKVPPKIPHAIHNIGSDDAYVINYCYPAFKADEPDQEEWQGDYDFKQS